MTKRTLWKPAYAILRIDLFQDLEVDSENRVKVVRVVWTINDAEAEVARLNELNRGKGCKYLWQSTRVAGDS